MSDNLRIDALHLAISARRPMDSDEDITKRAISFLNFLEGGKPIAVGPNGLSRCGPFVSLAEAAGATIADFPSEERKP